MFYQRSILIVLSLILNGLFLSVTNKKFFFAGLIASHGEVGYNLACYNTLQSNTARLALLEDQQNKERKLIDYASLTKEQRALKPTNYRTINDTIGYGVLLGILWKITQHYIYKDIQLLQIVLYCLCVMLFYSSCILIFSSTLYAFLCSLCLLLFLPLLFINVHPLRDVWAFYGLMVLCYSMIKAYMQPHFTYKVWCYALLFSICQWIRPPIFFSLVFFFIIFLCTTYQALKKVLFNFMIINLLLFWIPFCIYNYHVYDQLFVSCMGQDLYEGLGETANSWNILMDDHWCAQKLLKEYNLAYGTPSFQRKAYTLFVQAIRQHPTEYVWQVLRRIPSLFIFCATMLHDQQEFDWAYKEYSSLSMLYATKAMDMLTALQRKIYYGRLYLLIGWIGIVLLVAQGNYFLAVLIVGCAFSGASKIISHLEPRYLIPHYAFFAYAIGNLVLTLYRFLLLRIV